MLYKGLKRAASKHTYFVPLNKHAFLKAELELFTADTSKRQSFTREHHSLVFQTPFANTDIYKSSFFPQTIRDWNFLTDSLISSAISSAEGAEDSVLSLLLL